MATLIEHIIKLTDHRDRDLLELTLSKALIDLLPIQRITGTAMLFPQAAYRGPSGHSSSGLPFQEIRDQLSGKP